MFFLSWSVSFGCTLSKPISLPWNSLSFLSVPSGRLPCTATSLGSILLTTACFLLLLALFSCKVLAGSDGAFSVFAFLLGCSDVLPFCLFLFRGKPLLSKESLSIFGSNEGSMASSTLFAWDIVVPSGRVCPTSYSWLFLHNRSNMWGPT